jgi:Cof subfamily protein (haloacid dehalogenase superfamily)
MKMLIDALRLQHPIAAFNGGVVANPDLSVIRQYFLPAEAAGQAIKIIATHGLDVWLYTDKDWFVHNRHGSHVDREEWTVKFPPSVVPSYDGMLDRAVKIVGISDDYAAVARCEADVRRDCGQHVSAARSQPYYLDVTHPNANKGTVVRMFSEILGIPEENIATIGDMPNDVLMFEPSGMSIAMGQSRDEVKRAAHYVTASNQEDGFALAMERFVLAGDSTRLDHGAQIAPAAPASESKP